MIHIADYCISVYLSAAAAAYSYAQHPP